MSFYSIFCNEIIFLSFAILISYIWLIYTCNYKSKLSPMGQSCQNPEEL